MARSKSLAAAFGGRTGCARPAVGLLVVAVGWLSWELGSGLTGLGYLSLLALWAAPGVPIGAFVFGGRHPAAWLAGAALGYPLSALLLWLPIALGTPTPFAFAISWLTGTLGLWAWLWRRRRARVELPPWSSRDTVALSLVLLLVPVMTARPFLRIGEQDASGSRYYRAYFTADFVWHMALTAELERFSMDHSIGQALTMADHVLRGARLSQIDEGQREFWMPSGGGEAPITASQAAAKGSVQSK